MDTAHLLWGLAQWTIASAFVGAVSLRLARRLLPDPAYLRPALTLLLWVMLVSALVLVLAAGGWLSGPPVALVAGLGLAAMAADAWRRRGGPTPAPSEGAPAARLDRGAYALIVLLAGAAAAQALRLAAHVWFLAPYSWDALVYRLPKVAEWVQRGGFGHWETPVARSFWPANYELLETWFALFTHHDLIVDAASLPLYALAVCSVYAIVRALGLGAGAAAGAAALYAFTPAPALHAASVNNDLAVAGPYLLVTALLLSWRRTPAHTPAYAAAASAAVFYALGAKAYIVFIGPGLALLAAWTLASRRGAAVAATDAGPGVVLPGVLLALGILLGGYWYLRNALVFGNPFYPTDFTLFGRLLAGDGSGIGQQGTFSLDSLATSLSALWHTKMYDLAGPYLPDVNNMTGWGWFSFVCGPPALVLAVIRRNDMRWLSAAFALSLLSLLGWVSADAFNMRFTLWFPALAAISFAVMMSELRVRAVRLAFVALAVACSALNFAGTLNPGVISLHDWQEMARRPAAARSSAALLASNDRVGPSFRDALASVPAGEPIGYVMRDNSVIYLLYDADLSRTVRYVPLEPGTDVKQAMSERGLRYLFVWRAAAEQREAVNAAVEKGRLIAVGEGLYETADE